MSFTINSIRQKLSNFLFSKFGESIVFIVILINAASLGMETSKELVHTWGAYISLIDRICLSFFIVELSLKIFALGFRFFKDPWNLFDFIIISFALVPRTGFFSIFRSLRFLRILRIVSSLPRLRRVIEAMLRSIPSILGVGVILLIICYVYAVIGITNYGKEFPEFFGTIGRALFTLFQVMTLEGWPDIARDVIAKFPNAWIYFATVISITALIILNLIVSLLIDAISESREEEREQTAQVERQELEFRIVKAIESLEHDVKTAQIERQGLENRIIHAIEALEANVKKIKETLETNR